MLEAAEREGARPACCHLIGPVRCRRGLPDGGAPCRPSSHRRLATYEGILAVFQSFSFNLSPPFAEALANSRVNWKRLNKISFLTMDSPQIAQYPNVGHTPVSGYDERVYASHYSLQGNHMQPGSLSRLSPSPRSLRRYLRIFLSQFLSFVNLWGLRSSKS